MLRFVCIALALLCLLPALALSDPPGPPAPPWYPDYPLILAEFDAIPGPNSTYIFLGRILNHDPYSLTWVEITGVYEATIGVNYDGTFRHTTILQPGTNGGVAARAYDTWGRWSNEATDEVFN